MVGKFHHSSLLGGKSVASAGEITVKNGIVHKITRKSGHYMPEEKYLQQFVDELKVKGVNLNKVEIGGF
ncbi:MAG: hypothetical protein GY714_05920 [Desulfobacterales bacterium]|nr:hypothetical protein [Desulfobacterales bacterium]